MIEDFLANKALDEVVVSSLEVDFARDVVDVQDEFS